jgi:hypothetical protein
MSETKTYQFATLKEIFERVPTDRIRDCMSELGVLLAQAAGTRDLFVAVAEDAGLNPESVIPQLPEFFTWIDDGKGELSFHVHAQTESDEPGEELFTIKSSVNAD